MEWPQITGHTFIKLAKKVEQTIPNLKGTSKGFFKLSHHSIQWKKRHIPRKCSSPFEALCRSDICPCNSKEENWSDFSAEFFLYKELNEYRESGGGSQRQSEIEKEREWAFLCRKYCYVIFWLAEQDSLGCCSSPWRSASSPH